MNKMCHMARGNTDKLPEKEGAREQKRQAGRKFDTWIFLH